MINTAKIIIFYLDGCLCMNKRFLLTFDSSGQQHIDECVRNRAQCDVQFVDRRQFIQLRKLKRLREKKTKRHDKMKIV